MSESCRSERLALDAIKNLSPVSTRSGGNERKSAKTALTAALKEVNENVSRNLGSPYRSLLLLNELPLDCLYLIFGHIPMQELLSKHRLVCNYWCDIIEDMCQRDVKSLALHNMTKRIKIKFWLNELDERLYHDIKLQNFVQIYFNPRKFSLTNLCQFLFRLFPRPTELVIQFYRGELFAEFASNLFFKWSPQLTTFSFKYHYSSNSLLISVRKFIRNCTSLKRLDLNLNLVSGSGNKISIFDASQLNSLEHFSFNDWHYNNGFDFVAQLVESNPRFTRLWCQHPSFWTDTILKMAQSNPTWSANITHLILFISSHNTFQVLSHHFTSLKVLSLDFRCDFTLNDKVLKSIASLTILTDLKLNRLTIGTFILPPDYIPLSNVRKLHFNLHSEQNALSDEKKCGFYRTLAGYFPNLEEMKIENKSRIKLKAFAPYATLFPQLKKYSTPA